MASSNYRAKVYVLNSNGNWDDFGTGNVDLVQDNYKEINVNFLRVISDGTWKGESHETTKEMKNKLKSDREEESYILYRPILKEMEFQKQGAAKKSPPARFRPPLEEKSLVRKPSERAAKKVQKTEAKISNGKKISKVTSPDTRSSPKKVDKKIKKVSLTTKEKKEKKEKKASPKAVSGTGRKARKG